MSKSSAGSRRLLSQNSALYTLNEIIERMTSLNPEEPLKYLVVELLKKLGEEYHPNIKHEVGSPLLASLYLATQLQQSTDPDSLPEEIPVLISKYADKLCVQRKVNNNLNSPQLNSPRLGSPRLRFDKLISQADLIRRASTPQLCLSPPSLSRSVFSGCKPCSQLLSNVTTSSSPTPMQWWMVHDPPNCNIGIPQRRFYNSLSYEKVSITDARSHVAEALDLFQSYFETRKVDSENWRSQLLETACQKIGINKPAIQELVKVIVPTMKDVPDDEISTEVVIGGITNLLFKVSHLSNTPNNKPLLVRVFGAEGMIDRDLENATFQALADADIGPIYYGRFRNGRIEGWYEGFRPLELHEMPNVSKALAIQMSRLHQFKVPDTLKVFYSQPGMLDQILSWLRLAKQNTMIPGKFTYTDKIRFDDLKARYLGDNFERAEKEMEEMQKLLSNCFSPHCFCHNDLLAGNILINDSTGDIKIIDFEYGGCNYRGFDIANHWNEWAGGTQIEMNGKSEYDRFPTTQQQIEFCHSYLTVIVKNGKPTTKQVEDLVQEARRFVPVNHWYWGLWALNQAVDEGTAGFDYITYSETRLKQYFAIKHEYFGTP